MYGFFDVRAATICQLQDLYIWCILSILKSPENALKNMNEA